MKGRIGGLIALGAGFHPHVTGHENIYLNGTLLGMKKQELNQKFDEIVEFSEIGDFLDAPVSSYSSGMKVRLGFAIALQIKPDILLIDEVLAVGDRGFKIKCMNAISKIMENSAVIFVSHSMPDVVSIATKLMLLDQGHMVYYGEEVNAGINKYISMFPSSENRIFGPSKATISKVIIQGHNENSHQRPIVNYGDSLTLTMKIDLNHKIACGMVYLVIQNEESRPVIQVIPENSLSFSVPNTGRSLYIRITIPDIRLNAGKYSLVISVTDANPWNILTRVENVAEFQVSPIYQSWANEIWKGRWEIIEAA